MDVCNVPSMVLGSGDTGRERERELNWQCLHFGRNAVEGEGRRKSKKTAWKKQHHLGVFRDKR